MQSKVCNKCNQDKPIRDFYTHKSTADGYRPTCKPCFSAYQRDPNYRANKSTRAKEYYLENREAILKKTGEYQKKSPNRSKYTLRYLEKRKNDELFQVQLRIRGLLRNSFKRKKFSKIGHSQDIFGCSWEDLHTYLIATWNHNYPGKEIIWTEVHVDHIIPLCTAQTETDLLKLNHYSNLQLLLARDNLSKGGRHSK